jgi:hypothetical protein
MEIIDMKRALELLEQVVEKFGPETTYEDIDPGYGDCQYVGDDGKPRCLVGQALAKAGFEFPLNPHYMSGGTLNKYVNDGAYYYLTEYADEYVTHLAKTVFEVAQRAQDIGMTWGGALAAARERVVGNEDQ